MQNAHSINGEGSVEELVRRNDARAMRNIHKILIQPDYEITYGQLFQTVGMWIAAIVMGVVIWLMVFSFVSSIAQADEVDLDKIAMIESSGNPRAHNKKDDSRGLHQITPICLKEYNTFHPRGQRYAMDDLWNASVSSKIARWYLEVRIPQLLRHYGIKDTVRNRLICYNAGIFYLVKGKRLPETTKIYLKKYGV